MTPERRHRNVAHLWADKRVLRFFRKHPGLKSLSKRQSHNLRVIYIALCEIESDFGESATIRGLSRTLATYSGSHVDTVRPYLKAMRLAGLIDYHQTNEAGQFGSTGLALFKWEPEDEDEVAKSIVNALTTRIAPKPGAVKAGSGETSGYKNPKGGKDKNPSKEGIENSSMRRRALVPNLTPTERHRQLAVRLQVAIGHRRHINKTINLSLWPNEIRKLCKALGGKSPEGRLHRAIKFLDRSYKQYGMQSERFYIPTIESVATLRSKLGKIEDAMAREEQSGHRIIVRRGGETVLDGGEPSLDKKWFPVEDLDDTRIWENADGDRVEHPTYPQPDLDGPMLGRRVEE